jgi:hypothetical protein
VGFTTAGKASRISVEGGAAIPVAGVVSRDGGWGEDGRPLVVQTNRGLSRIPAGGGPPEIIAEPRAGEMSFGEAQMLPGGNAILGSTDNPGPVDVTTIDVVTLADRQRKTVIRGGASPRYVATGAGTGYLLYVNGATLFAMPFDLNTLTTRGSAVPLVDDVAHEGLRGLGQFDVSRTGTLVYRKAVASASELKTLQWVEPSGRRVLFRSRAGLQMAVPVLQRQRPDLSVRRDEVRQPLPVRRE